MDKNLKILYVCTALIAPPHTGCMIRTINIARKLKNRGKVTLLAVAGKLDENSVRMARREFDNVHLVKLKDYSEYGDRRGDLIKKFHMHWPWSEGRKANQQDQELFRKLAAEHDIVWFHTLGAANPFDFVKLPKSVMDLDDLNHCKYSLRSGQDKTLRLRLSARLQSWKWKKQEFEALRKYDRIVVCSEDDKKLLDSGEKIHVIPNGFAKPETKPEWKKPNELRIGFIGAFSYWVNRNGLIWFRDSVWPLIKQEKTNVELRLIGTPSPKKDLVEADGFKYLGYIEDPTEEIQTWSAMVVPLLIGGGTRIKILDAFSKMCPVVTTPTGAYGLSVESGTHLLIRETPEEFAKACFELSYDFKLGKALSENGWKLLAEKYDWEIIANEIYNVISKVK